MAAIVPRRSLGVITELGMIQDFVSRRSSSNGRRMDRMHHPRYGSIVTTMNHLKVVSRGI